LKLLIISHTEHYISNKGDLVGWGPTITEINHLSKVFDKIYHIGVLKEGNPPKSSKPYTNENIEFIPLHFTGGTSLLKKMNIIWNMPSTVFKVFKTLHKVDVFQLRTPTGIGVYLIPLLTLFSRKKGWYKYAGNWNQENPPLGYALQRWFLKNQKRKVTINGHWENQPKHCITFENPCLTRQNIIEGDEILNQKLFVPPYIYSFAGRLEEAKGVRRIIDALNSINDEYVTMIKEVHLIGDGNDRKSYEELAKKSKVNIIFHSFINTEELFEIFKKSHYFLLPSSASEGFPKVISEALNFGCIPIISDVSALKHYFTDMNNALIVNPITSVELKLQIEKSINLTKEVKQNIQNKNQAMKEKFTYEYYIHRIKTEILGH